MNVLNRGSYLRLVDFKEASVDGMFCSPFDIWASVVGSVEKNFRKSQAGSLCLAPFGMPMIVPIVKPDPYRSDFEVGSGAVPKEIFGFSALMKPSRYSPSSIIASLPRSKAFEAENSSPAPACHLTSLS